MNALLRRLAKPPNLLNKTDTIERAAARHNALAGRVLNIGSKNVRLGAQCTNFDIADGPEVDVVGDAHKLAEHFAPESFDTVVLSAVLQYCAEPRRVIEQAWRVLRPDGLLLIDAPFLQPYCPDRADLWRFTADGLRKLCEPHFMIIELKTSIALGPALGLICQSAATLRPNRYAAATLGWLVSLAVYPLKWMRPPQRHTAGAFVLVAQKKCRSAHLGNSLKTLAMRSLA
jgi:SAM-dependent methyltransferase